MTVATVPHDFVAQTLAKASEANANFDAILGFLNGEAIQKDASVAFTAVPTGPAVDPSSDNQLARKKYVDDRLVQYGNITLADGTYSYGVFFAATSFVVAKAGFARIHVVAAPHNLNADTKILRADLRQTAGGATVYTGALSLPAGTGSYVQVGGASQWLAVTPGTWEWRFVVDADNVPSGSIALPAYGGMNHASYEWR